MKLASASDHAISGLTNEELAAFYHGLAVNIATQLSRVQVRLDPILTQSDPLRSGLWQWPDAAHVEAG